jgi:hypothetical protein
MKKFVWYIPRINKEYYQSLCSMIDYSEIRNTSIQHRVLNNMKNLNTTNCTVLSCSPLKLQCEVVRIRFKNRINVFDLIKQMLNLQLWTFEFQYAEENDTNDNFVKWLETYSRDKNFWDTQEWLSKISYFIPIKLYIC